MMTTGKLLALVTGVLASELPGWTAREDRDWGLPRPVTVGHAADGCLTIQVADEYGPNKRYRVIVLAEEL